ncbi:MAG: hypothetical protein WD226_03830 [Planctomycetota bacterium]
MKLRLSALVALALPATADVQLVWYQSADNYTTIGSTVVSAPAIDVEAADDFVFTGAITRVIAHGYAGFGSGGTLAIDGVWVRFYADTGSGPGALQYEVFVPEGAAHFTHDAYPSNLDVTLPAPFQASGSHFVAVQLVTPGNHTWANWSANVGNPAAAPAHTRNNLAAGSWAPFQTVLGAHVDLAFELWGDDGTSTGDPVDPCGAWQIMEPPPFPANYRTVILRDVVAIANDDVWAVGDPSVEVQTFNYKSRTLAMHWDGDEWSRVPTPDPGAIPAPNQRTSLVAVDASGANDVWAVGNYQIQDPVGFLVDQPLVLRWQGSQWSHLPTPLIGLGTGITDGSTYDVDVVAQNDVWIVGFGGGQPVATHWDGSGFSVFYPDFSGLGGGTPGLELTAVDGSAANDVWAVGGGSDGDFSPLTVVAHWNGSDWQPVAAPAPGLNRRLFDVHVRASDDVWAVGQYAQLVGSSLEYFGFALHWNGASWRLFDSALEPVGSLAVHAFGPNDVYSAGAQIYHYDGTGWSVADDLEQSSGDVIQASIAGLDAAEDCHLWAVGRQDLAGALMPITARQQGPSVWATTPRSCANAPGLPGGLELVSGPKLGTTFDVRVGDPNGLAGVTPSLTHTFWAASRNAFGNCVGTIAGAGALGNPAALLIDWSPLLVLNGPITWNGVGTAALHSVPIPNNVSLTGFTFSTQGFLFDPTVSPSLRLTNALDARLGE